MKKLLLFLFAVFISLLSAQSLADLNFGSDDTFEIMTWNIEWFPKNGTATVDSVSLILQALDIDLYAFQEITDTTSFKQMINAIDGYDYYFYSSWYAGLAYAYKSDLLEIESIYEIYTEEPFWRPFPRSPMVMEMTYAGQDFVIINNHFKAGGDGYLDLSDQWDEETRRYDASNLLNDYIMYNHNTDNLIVLGDLNDSLTDSPTDNVFQVFLVSPEDYLFTDMEIAESSSSEWSYPGWPSHLDHILITDELFDEFENTGSEIQTLKIDEYMTGGFNTYDYYISDHRPVALKLNLQTNNIEDESISQNSSLGNFPNPFSSTTKIFFSLSAKDTENAKIEIYNIKGQVVREFKIKNDKLNMNEVIWDGNDQNDKPVESGIYFYRLQTEKYSLLRKCILLR